MPEESYVLSDPAAREVVAAIRDLRARPPTAGRRARRAPVVRSGGTTAFNAVEVSRGSDQSINTGTLTPINFTSEIYDTDTFHDTVTDNDRLTIPTGLGGKYVCNVRLEWEGNAAGTYREAEVTILGNVVAKQTIFHGGSARQIGMTLNVVTVTSATEYWQVKVIHDAGVGVNIKAVGTGSSPRFVLIRVPGSS